MIQINNLSITIQDKDILKAIDFRVEQGQWLMIVGPNGSGKSSLVKAIGGIYPYSGNIELMNQAIRSYSSKQRAQKLAILSQHGPMSEGFTVREVVELGRYAYNHSFIPKLTREDDEAVENALVLTGMTQLSQTKLHYLSGGEIQRTFLAQVFAQDPNVLILDEPSNHLDLVYEKIIFETVEKWLQEPNRCVISIVHDISLALKYGSHGLLLNQGQLVSFGDIDQCFSNQNLSQVYQTNVADYFLNKYLLWLNRSEF